LLILHFRTYFARLLLFSMVSKVALKNSAVPVLTQPAPDVQ